MGRCGGVGAGSDGQFLGLGAVEAVGSGDDGLDMGGEGVGSDGGADGGGAGEEGGEFLGVFFWCGGIICLKELEYGIETRDMEVKTGGSRYGVRGQFMKDAGTGETVICAAVDAAPLVARSLGRIVTSIPTRRFP